MDITRGSSSLLVLFFCLSSSFAQTKPTEVPAQNTNEDVGMTKTRPAPNLLIETVKTPEATFESPPATQAVLKGSGVPEIVIRSAAERVAVTAAGQLHSAAAAGPTAGTDSSEPALRKRSETNCEIFDGGPRKNGVVWCGLKSTLNFEVLAERTAPILWFSPNEQLLLKKYKIPQPIPCDESYSKVSKTPDDMSCKRGDYCVGHRNDKSAVVYYQVRRILRKPGTSGGAFVERDLNLDKIEKLTLKYYFYYCVDCGFGGHRHDLENIEFEIIIEKENSGPRYRARVVEVLGAAHGVHWFNNRLKVKDDTVFPVTILVEKGKHASAPDNDGRGTYEHNQDINHRVRDAWGLRDTLTEREWVPLFPYYLKRHTNQDRPSAPHYRVGARAQVASHPDIFENYLVATRPPSAEKLKQPQELYDLKELGSDCTLEKVKKMERTKDFDMLKVLTNRGAFAKPSVVDSSNRLLKTIRSSLLIEEEDTLPENLWVRTLQLSYRWDQSHGFSFTPPLPVGFLFNGYIVPRVHLTGFSNGSRRYGFDYLYTPSAARWADWYVAGGIEWYRERPGRPFKFGPAWEGGIKFRFPLNMRRKLYAGFRLGVRTSPTKNFSIVAEPGGGLF